MARELPDVEQLDLNLSKQTLNYLPLHAETLSASRKANRVVSLFKEDLDRVREETEETLGKQHQIEINKFQKRILDLSNTIETYKQKYEFHRSTAEKLLALNRQFEEDNKRLLLLVTNMEMEFRDKEKLFNEHVNKLEERHKGVVEQLTQDSMKRELDLQAKIELLTHNLEAYSQQLEHERQKYEKREEKIKNIFS